MSTEVRTPDLAFTGERFVPGVKGEIWVEHWHRYHFARRWTAGRRVLDVACGEGYGAALLASGAAHVTGVDLSHAAIDHACATYAAVPNLEFRWGSCTALPLGDASVGVAVSFETLEHIEAQEAFLAELARVLEPGGVLILSCPNKLEYSDRRGFANEFHVRELYREELAELVAARFPEVEWYGQRPTFFSLIAPEKGRAERGCVGHLVEVSDTQPAEALPHLESPLYFVLVAARDRASLDAVAPALSVLADRDDWAHRDYEKVMRESEANYARAQALDKQMGEREHAIAVLNDRANKLEMAITLQETAIAAQRALVDAQAAAYAAHVAEQQREIDRRRGWRWWFRLPLIRLGILKEASPIIRR